MEIEQETFLNSKKNNSKNYKIFRTVGCIENRPYLLPERWGGGLFVISMTALVLTFSASFFLTSSKEKDSILSRPFSMFQPLLPRPAHVPPRSMLAVPTVALPSEALPLQQLFDLLKKPPLTLQ